MALDNDKRDKKKSKDLGTQVELEDLDLADANAAILSSLNDISEHLEDFDDDEVDVDADSLLADVPDALPDDPSDQEVNEAEVEQDILKHPRVHVVETPDEEDERDEMIRSLRNELLGASEEAANLNQQLLHLRSDFENFKRRSRRSQEEAEQNMKKRLALDLLPVVDTLQAGLESMVDDQDNPMYQGYEMAKKMFDRVLMEHRIEPIETVGVPFDPRVHEAVGTEETNDVSPNHIVAEVLRGYVLDNKTIRASRVIVAKAAPKTPTNEDVADEIAQLLAKQATAEVQGFDGDVDESVEMFLGPPEAAPPLDEAVQESTDEPLGEARTQPDLDVEENGVQEASDAAPSESENQTENAETYETSEAQSDTTDDESADSNGSDDEKKDDNPA